MEHLTVFAVARNVSASSSFCAAQDEQHIVSRGRVLWLNRGKNIGDPLQMEIDEAVEFFASMPHIVHPLQRVKDVGLPHARLAVAHAERW
jgi:hypothetical protein